MSFEFSRRSFLKYTAVVAVAVAGSSLLSGCKDNATELTGTGSITNVQVTATILNTSTKKPTFDSTTGIIKIPMTVENKRKNQVMLDDSHFAVVLSNGKTADDVIFPFKTSAGKTLDGLKASDLNLENGSTASFTLTVDATKASNYKGFAGIKTVTVRYIADTSYNEYESKWNLTVGTHIKDTASAT